MACFITSKKIEKIMEVMIKTFLPAGRRAKIMKETMGKNIPRLRNSFLELFMGEKSIWRASKQKIKPDWMRLRKVLGMERSY